MATGGCWGHGGCWVWDDLSIPGAIAPSCGAWLARSRHGAAWAGSPLFHRPSGTAWRNTPSPVPASAPPPSRSRTLRRQPSASPVLPTTAAHRYEAKRTHGGAPIPLGRSIPPSAGDLSTLRREKLRGQSDASSIKDAVPTPALPCLQKPVGSSSLLLLSFVFPLAPLTPPARVPPLRGRDLLLPGPQVPPGELATHIFKIAVARETYAFGTRHHQ